MKISATLNCNEILSKKNNIYNFGLGSNPLKQPQCFIEYLRHFSDKKDYVSASGIPELKNIIKDKYSDYNYKVNNIIVGNGLKELLYLVQLVFQGKIFHITPSWVSYKEQILIMNRENDLVEIHTDLKNNYKINIDELELKLKQFETEKKLLIFNNPNNPLGIFYNEEEVCKIAKILKKYNCIVLADEIYFDLTHFNKIKSISEYIPELTIRGTSISKNMACGGYRLGWITFPKELDYLFNKCNSYASSIYSCANLPTQYATYKMLENKQEFDNFIRLNNTIYKYIINKIIPILNSSNIKFVTPNSSWYIFLNFDLYSEKLTKIDINSSIDLNDYLLNKLNILTVAGEHFNAKGLNIRFSLVNIDTKLLEKYYKFGDDITQILDKHPNILNKIIEGINILVSHFNSI